MTALPIERAVQDSLLSKQIIEQYTGVECRTLAYPFGRFNDALADELSKHFISAVSTAASVTRYRRSGGNISFRNSPVEHYPENVMGLNRVYSF